MNNTFTPKNLYRKFLQYWFYLPIAMILGGLIGLALHVFIHPIYEGQVKFVVAIDYTRTGYLSDIQEDQAMRSVGSLIGSDYVLQKTVDSLNSAKLDITLAEIKEKSMLERGEFGWYIHIRDQDPEKASMVVNYWADQANQVLKDALSHTLKAEELLNVLDSIEMCLQRATLNTYSVPPCDLNNINPILDEIQVIGEQAYQEKGASLGLMPALSVNLVEKSLAPEQPVVFAQNLFVLAGAIIGLIVMFVWLSIFEMDESKKKATKRHRA